VFQHGDKIFQMLINISVHNKNMIRSGEISLYESFIADVIFSFWYNGINKFTARKLMSYITGNDNLSFHKGLREKIDEQIGEVIKNLKLPVIAKTKNELTTYFFNENAINCTPGAFSHHEKALFYNGMCNIPDGVLSVMSKSSEINSRKKRRDETQGITAIKYYLLCELNRIFGYSGFHDKHIYEKKPRKYVYVNYNYNETSSLIVYNWYDKNKPEGERHSGMKTISDFDVFSNDSLHKNVCAILNNLKKYNYIPGYMEQHYKPEKINEAIRRGWIPDSKIKGNVPKGVKLFRRKK